MSQHYLKLKAWSLEDTILRRPCQKLSRLACGTHRSNATSSDSYGRDTCYQTTSRLLLATLSGAS